MTREEIINELKNVVAPYTNNKEMLASLNDQTNQGPFKKGFERVATRASYLPYI